MAFAAFEVGNEQLRMVGMQQPRGAQPRQTGLWAIKKKNGGKFPTHAKKEAVAAATDTRPSKFYPADDVAKPLARKAVRRPAKLRASITPGTVLILLAGRFKGKRVVFLRQLPSGTSGGSAAGQRQQSSSTGPDPKDIWGASRLTAAWALPGGSVGAPAAAIAGKGARSKGSGQPSHSLNSTAGTLARQRFRPTAAGAPADMAGGGLLLVTGPFKLNGVPLRRVNQAYVIATSTRVDVSGVDAEKFDDAYFKSAEKKQRKQGEKEFFAEAPAKKELPAEYVENQKSVDSKLLSALSDELKGYLSTRFTLRASDRPHLLKF
ncbi:hypothetical protein N2152v2_002619 [Parachlorella kessleri]